MIVQPAVIVFFLEELDGLAGEALAINRRQRRTDEETAKAVTRGVNIIEVRGWLVARRYMEHKKVPEHVIARVLAYPELRRKPSPEQAKSEAIMPLPPAPRR